MQSFCRCETYGHSNHPGVNCAAVATEAGNYCKPCHDKAADKPMATKKVSTPSALKPKTSPSPNIQISKTPEEGEFALWIAGEQINATVIGGPGTRKKPAFYLAIFKSIEATQKLFPLTVQEIEAAHINVIQFPYTSQWFDALGELVLSHSGDEVSLSMRFSKLSRWREPFTFEDYFRTLQIFVDADKSGVVSVHETPIFSLTFPINKPWPLKTEIERCENILREFHKKVIEKLHPEANQSLIVSFDFPEEVRVPCEQYLLYFVEFLADVGVKATANIRHEAGNVLFAVTPDDRETALDKIHIALGEYLNLARTPVSDASIGSIAEQRLAANVDHLKGQLRLKNAELQLAQATIQTQQVAIQVLKGDVLIESVKVVMPQKSADNESFLGGTVALKPFNYKGVEVNYPEIFRKLRDLFRKGSK